MLDEQLIPKLTNGDAAAFETLYDRYAPAVMGLAMKMLHDQSAAEEVVQETFWRVWRQAGTFSEEHGTFSGWLFGIARNLAIDTWRRGKIRPQPAASEEESQLMAGQTDPAADVDQSAWAAIKHRQVREAMSVLPPEQRQVIELAYFWGMTRQEIAEFTGVPLGTIHTRARLGLQKLRDSLKGQGFEDG